MKHLREKDLAERDNAVAVGISLLMKLREKELAEMNKLAEKYIKEKVKAIK